LFSSCYRTWEFFPVVVTLLTWMQPTNKVTPTLSAEPEQQRQAFYAALRLVTIDYRRRSGHKVPPNASGFPCRSDWHGRQASRPERGTAKK